MTPASLPVGSIDLDHFEAVAAQMTSQSCAVGVGAFHSDPLHGSCEVRRRMAYGSSIYAAIVLAIIAWRLHHRASIGLWLPAWAASREHA